MEITSNNLLAGTSKNIQFYRETLMTKEGPNMLGKIDLTSIQIPFDSFFTAKITIPSKGQDMPIMYGFLGTNITFLLLKANYSDTGQLRSSSFCSGNTFCIEYYFEDEPLVKRYFKDIMILSGNDINRIPLIYLYNPNSNDITIEFLAANLNPNEITSLITEYAEITGLAFNSVITDQVFSLTCTGSTQFEILDIDGNTQMVIPYNNIDIITIENQTLSVKTKNDDSVKLTFLSMFNAQQAFSRINWTIENSMTRYLTPTYVGLDTTGPIIYFNSGTTNVIMNQSGITKDDIRNRYINYVEDFDDNNISRDGIINNQNVEIVIIKQNTGEQFEIITQDGLYNLKFIVRDLATNTTNITKNLLVDSTPPVIYFFSGLTYNMSLSGDTQTPGTIEKNDINRYSLDYVYDLVDGVIPNGNVIITISQGATTFPNIVTVGTYSINFSVSDNAGNITQVQKTITVIV